MRRRPRRRPVVAGGAAAARWRPVPAVARGGASRRRRSPCPRCPTGRRNQGSYVYGRGARLVADSAAERRVADTLADDLRAAGHGTVPVVRGGARTGDIVIDVEPSRAALGTEGYELRAGKRLSITGATETGAFYGTRTLLQLLAQGDRIPAGRTVDVPRYEERGVGVCACYIHISTAWLENLVRDMAYHKLNQLLARTEGEERRPPRGQHLGLLHQGRDPPPRRPRREVPRRRSSPRSTPRGTWTRGSRTARTSSSPTPTATSSRPGSTSPSPRPSTYYTSLIDEYAQVFTADSWHMGADEYMLGSDFAKYPQILRVRPGRSTARTPHPRTPSSTSSTASTPTRRARARSCASGTTGSPAPTPCP